MRSKILLAGVMAALLAPAVAQAQNRIIPPLAQAGQIVVVDPVTSNPQVATECGVDTKKIQNFIVQYLTKEALPVLPPERNAEMVRSNVFRLTLRPEVATLKDGVVSCVSWVALRAHSPYTLRLPPVTDQKTVNVAYWDKGALTLTSVVDHATGIDSTLTVLLRAFVQQYRMDNPGQMPVTNGTAGQ